MTEDLASGSCRPCRRGDPPLTPAEVARLRAGIPQWSVADDRTRLVRRFVFRDFAAAFDLVARAAAVAESERHHPDVRVGWGYAEFALTTHAIEGLHRNDFILAAKIDRLAAP